MRWLVVCGTLLFACGSPASPEACTGDECSQAAWPMPAPFGSDVLPAPAYDVHDGVVVDLVTRLQWAPTWPEKLTLVAAQDRCAGLVLGNHDDWRLPSRIELVSISDPTRSPAFDDGVFPDLKADYFWSATRVAARPTHVWTLYFGQGLTGASQADGLAFGKCVRNPQAQRHQPFEVEGDLVNDVNSGRQWQRQPSDAPLTWAFARELCAAQTAPGKLGFRLPTIKELQTIIADDKIAPAFSSGFMIAAPVLWAQDAVTTSHFAMQDDGTTLLQDNAFVAHALCVR